MTEHHVKDNAYLTMSPAPRTPFRRARVSERQSHLAERPHPRGKHHSWPPRPTPLREIKFTCAFTHTDKCSLANLISRRQKKVRFEHFWGWAVLLPTIIWLATSDEDVHRVLEGVDLERVACVQREGALDACYK